MYELNANTTTMWDTDYFYELMDDKRIFSTVDSKKIREQLNEVGALPELSNHYDWATLCISYALMRGLSQHLDKIKAVPTGSNGYEIKSFKTCFQEQKHLWLAILSEQLFQLYPDKKINKDDLYQYITQLWHIGAVALFERWQSCQNHHQDSQFEARKLFASELMNLANKNLQSAKPMNPDSTSVSELTNQPQLVFDDAEHDSKLKEAFDSLSIPVKSIDYLSKGLRYDCYQIQLTKYQDLIKKHDEICSALGRNETAVIIESADGIAFGYNIKILRPQHEWLERNQHHFEQALRQFNNDKNYELPMYVGLDEQGNALYRDLTTAPHVFVAGSAGAGKSVCMRGIVQSLFTLNDDHTKIEIAILDPKMVDYTEFKDEQNLYQHQIIDNIDAMVDFLNECIDEMEQRYEQMKNAGFEKWSEYRKFDPQPYRIIVIDEVADMFMQHDDIQNVLVRLAQKGRASGIHLILSTQTPNSEIMSQTLKANIMCRLAMKTTTANQSKVILDEHGAEKLLGKGDHLIKWGGDPIVFAHSYNI